MDSGDMRAFLVLADTLHFGRAATQLHMSPSALSRTLQKIEAELGHVLLLRDRRHVSLTQAGRLVRTHAHSQLQAEGLLREQLLEEKRSPSGEIRLACTVTACHSVLPDVLSRCRERYPGLMLRLMTSDAAVAADRLTAGEADIAVLPLAEQVDAGWAVQPLAHTELCFIARADDPLYLDLGRPGGPSFSDVPLILPQQGLERRRIDRFLNDGGVTPEIYAEVSGNEAIIAMVSLGCGVGLVPELVLSGSPLQEGISRLAVPQRPAGFTVAACATQRQLQRRAVAAFWALFDEIP